jgi:CheY-like chemotaxis protein
MNASQTILIVDDDPGHSELISRNLKRTALRSSIVQLTSGGAALAFIDDEVRLQRSGGSRLLMLLDIKKPGALDGIEVLRRVKTDPGKRTIPVIMLTTSDDPREVSRCYDLGCNAYVTKPVDSAEFVDAIHRLGTFLAEMEVPLERELDA